MSTGTTAGLPLCLLSSGARCVLVAIGGGEEMRKKVLDFGLVPGEEFEVITGRRNHPFLLKVRGTRVMLGWGIASRLSAAPLP